MLIGPIVPESWGGGANTATAVAVVMRKYNCYAPVKISHIRPRSGQRSKSSLFTPSVTKMGLKTVESPNFF